MPRPVDTPAGDRSATAQSIGGGDKPDKPDEALRFRLLQMQDENKQIAADALLKAKAQVEVMQAAQQRRAETAGAPDGLEVARLAPNDWQWLGPGNVGGRIRSIAIHPTTPEKMWIGSVGGGIWKTNDAGNSWQPVNDFMASLSISSLVIDPVNPSVMYAGTGELFAVSNPDGLGFTPDGLRGLGVFKSTDGGVTWNQLPSTNPADPAICTTGGGVDCAWSYITRLSISPDGATILAATSRGIWRSTDAGVTWAIGTGTANTTFFDVDFDPANSQLAIASGGAQSRFSTDAGQTWTAAAFAPAISLAGGGSGRIEVAHAPSNPSIVYALVDQITPSPAASPSPTPPTQGRIYRSTDGGRNYARVNTTPGLGILGTQGGYDNIIWVNPQDPAFIIAGGIDLWRSTDSGMTFTQISRWQCGPGQPQNPCSGQSAHADHHMIVAAPGFNNTTNKRVYFANDGGMFRADDVSTVTSTTGWTNLNRNLGITQFYSGVAGPTGIYLGGTQDNGSLRNTAQPSPSPATFNPQAWTTPVGAGGDGGYVAADPSDSNYLYTEYINLAIERSSDGGLNTTSITANLPDAGCGTTTPCPTANFIAPFILDPNNAGRMLAGGTSLWRSDDVKTATQPAWASIKAPLSNGLFPPANIPISAIAVAEGNSDIIVVGHNTGEIFRTSDGTATAPTWARIDTAAVPNRFVTRLAIDATRSPIWIYATFGGFSPDNVYVTKDLGTTWTDITGSGTSALPDVPVRSLLIHPVRPDLIYVGTEVGVFASEDAGLTWQLPQGGPANVSVDELFWAQGFLAAATHGRGIYTTNKQAFVEGAGTPGEGDGFCVYSGVCDPNYNCTPGDWDCPCTWAGGRVPTAFDDVAVQCANIRGSSRTVNNMRVNRRLSMADGAYINVNGTLANYHTISGGNISVGRDLVNDGTISTGRVWAKSGNIYNGGVLLASAGYGYYSGEEYPVQANDITVNGNGSLSAVAVLVKRNLFITADAELKALSGGPAVNYIPGLFVQGDVFNDGFLDVRGEMAFATFNDYTSAHKLSGSGEWRIGALSLGSRSDAWFGPPAMFVLESDVTLDVTGLTAYGNWDPTTSLLVAAEATIKQNNHRLTINAPHLRSYGQFDLGTGSLDLRIPYIKTQSIVSPGRNNIIGPPGFKGSGVVNLTAQGNTYLELATRVFDPALRLVAGTVDGVMGTNFKNLVTIDAGATLNVNRGTLSVFGDLLVNGTIGKTSASNVRSGFSFHGNSITNNGSIGGDIFEFNYHFEAVPRTQTISGTGSWPAATLVRVGFVNAATNVVLANDVTLNWGTLAIRSNSRIDTGAFTATMPCHTTFDLSNPNSTGEIVGTVRKTGIGECGSNEIPFTSPYTSVRFDSGAPPDELTVSVGLATPAGLPDAVKRNYFIRGVGGGSYSATLRLDYSPAELNGNSRDALALWRNDGSGWLAQGRTAIDGNADWIELSGVSQFGTWGIASCALAVLPQSTSVASGGGTGSFEVVSTGGCGWTATSDASWISVTSGGSGTGNGTVQFTVASNGGGAKRVGTISVAGMSGTRTFTVTQQADCGSVSLQPSSQSFSENGGPGSVTVSSSCEWTASSQVDWIVITTAAEGNGNGSFGYYVYYNSGPARTGTINVAGQPFTVTQASGCAVYLQPQEQGIAAAGGDRTVEVYTENGCPWQASSNAPWITITSATSGTGPTTLTYNVAANPGAPRAGTITISGVTLTVQQGSSTALSLVVTNTGDAGGGSFRQALLDANANFGQTNTISFNIAGPVIITPSENLPSITNPLIINGINADGRRIVLDGNYGAAYHALHIVGSDSTVRGLCMIRFNSGAITLEGARNVVENCYLGTTPAGESGLGNYTGIYVYSAANRVGGSAPGTANVISSNYNGVVIYGTSNVVAGNYVGTNAAGANLGNTYDGINIGQDGNTIGGTSPNAGNVIAFNGQNGVNVSWGARNSIRGNSIFSNGALGIDVGSNGVTAGAPVLSVIRGANTITGALNAAANGIFGVDLFASDQCDPSGNGEGRSYLGTIAVTTDANGLGSFSFDLPTSVRTRDQITATATDVVGSTTEFSGCAEVTPLRIGVIQPAANGVIRLQGIGVPNEQHTAEIFSTLGAAVAPTNTVIVTADAEGKWQFEDSAAGASARFYRVRFP